MRRVTEPFIPGRQRAMRLTEWRERRDLAIARGLSSEIFAGMTARLWLDHGICGSERAAIARFLHLSPARAIQIARLTTTANDWRAEKERRRKVRKRTRDSVLARDGYRCRYCGCRVSAKAAEIDHVVPINRGGRSRLANLVASCWQCNLKKSDHLLSELGWALLPESARPLNMAAIPAAIRPGRSLDEDVSAGQTVGLQGIEP